MSEVIDWDKPIQFENGEPCELIETHPNGMRAYPDRTRVVHRIGVKDLESSIWRMSEDGKFPPGSMGERGGFNIVNVPS